MKITKELVAASSAPLVLGILAEGESYGYEILQQVRELSGGEMEWTDGMLYPVLHWLEANDYAKAEWRVAETGRKRRYYTLRPGGRKYLTEQKDQWMTVFETLRRTWRKQNA
jgi:PadR family transcriptional regulator, regulatory protein PadR